VVNELVVLRGQKVAPLARVSFPLHAWGRDLPLPGREGSLGARKDLKVFASILPLLVNGKRKGTSPMG